MSEASHNEVNSARNNVNPQPDPTPNSIVNDESYQNRQPTESPEFYPGASRAHLKDIGPTDPYIEIPKLGFDHWKKCADAVEKYDNDMCKDWKEDIDTLLVFIGLFTAIVTAFTIESYQWLQPDPSDTTNQLLFTITQQLSGANVTAPANLPSSSDFVAENVSIRINCFWFSSIGISLFAALICIVCKQWLREYQRNVAAPYNRALTLRQFRFESLEQWRVPEIIQAPSLMLLGALFLFFAGVLDLLWYKIRSVVAIPLSVIVGFAGVFIFATTLAPVIVFITFHPISELMGWVFSPVTNAPNLPCAYKSPQAWIAFRIVTKVSSRFGDVGRWYNKFRSWLQVDNALLDAIRWHVHQQELTAPERWAFSEYYGFEALSWISSHLSQEQDIKHSLLPCFQELSNEIYQDFPDPHEESWEVPIVEATRTYNKIQQWLIREPSFSGGPYSAARLELILHSSSSYSDSQTGIINILRPLPIPGADLNQSTKSALWAHLYRRLERFHDMHVRSFEKDVIFEDIVYAALWQPMPPHEPCSIRRPISNWGPLQCNSPFFFLNALILVKPPVVSEDFLEFYKLLLSKLTSESRYSKRVLEFNSQICKWGNLDANYFDSLPLHLSSMNNTTD